MHYEQIFSHSQLQDKHFSIQTKLGNYESQSIVVATGGLSLPKIGASPLAYKIADQYQIPVKATRAGLVPFTLHQAQKELLSSLSGISFPATASYRVKNTTKKEKTISFIEAPLFTHRGLIAKNKVVISW